MAKNDFDLDFDFEKEYGFDPNAILDSEYTDEDLDLAEFADEDLGVDLTAGDEEPEIPELEEEQEEIAPAAEEEDEFGLHEDLDAELEDALDFDADEDFRDDFDEGDDLMDFSRRASFFEAPVQDAPTQEVSAEEEYTEAPVYQEEAMEDQVQEQIEEMTEAEAAEGNSSRRRAPHIPRTPREPVKFTVPPVLMKLVKLYFPSPDEINPKIDLNDPNRRRRKRSKAQTFKEYYLPTIIAGLAVVMVVFFIIGSLSNAIERKRVEDQNAQLAAQASSEAAALAEQQSKTIVEQAKLLAMGYDYDAAITLLESYVGDATEEIDLLRAEYLNTQSKLVEHKDASVIPNLSFHVLIEDPARAFADKELGGQYNRNFVTTDEFSRILDQLYTNNYVLVDFDSFVSSNTGTDGRETFFVDPILLPQGKKPVMITETMVNYYEYMTDGNKDGVADASGSGFASKLVVDANGDIKAEYVDVNGQTLVGDYDLVPILESFIEAHPDFSYRGARATLAVSGHEGVFGYRINTSVVSTKGQTYYEEQVAGAKEIVEALRAKGYSIANYTFGDVDYAQKNVAQIQQDMQQWNSQIAPVLGDVNIMVFAKSSDIGDYGGNKFDVLSQYGIRYFVKNAAEPYAEVNNTYVRQSRIMVTGNAMAWKSTQFTNLALFDPNTVLDMTARGGNVPN